MELARAVFFSLVLPGALFFTTLYVIQTTHDHRSRRRSISEEAGYESVVILMRSRPGMFIGGDVEGMLDFWRMSTEWPWRIVDYKSYNKGAKRAIETLRRHCVSEIERALPQHPQPSDYVAYKGDLFMWFDDEWVRVGPADDNFEPTRAVFTADTDPGADTYFASTALEEPVTPPAVKRRVPRRLPRK